MDEILVSVYDSGCDEWFELDGAEVPKSLDDDMAVLVGKGLVYESQWSPGSVTVAVIREDASGPRVIYEGK